MHSDFKGPQRLKSFFSYTKPEIIIIEASRGLIERRLQDRENINNKAKEIISRLDTKIESDRIYAENVMRFVDMVYYEISSSYEYKSENPKTIILPAYTDNTSLMQIYDQLGKKAKEKGVIFFNNFDEKSIKFLKDLDIKKNQDCTDEIYQKCNDLNDPLFGNSKTLENAARNLDDLMESNIRHIVDLDPQANIVFPCGAGHIYGDYKNNLYDRLVDLSPQRFKLVDVDKL